MNERVFCKTESTGRQAFYLQQEDEVYFLFCQDYRKGNDEFFGRGVLLNHGLDYSGGKNYAVRKTMEKLRIYLRYAEKEYGIAVFEKTKTRAKKGGRRYQRTRMRDNQEEDRGEEV